MEENATQIPTTNDITIEQVDKYLEEAKAEEVKANAPAPEVEEESSSEEEAVEAQQQEVQEDDTAQEKHSKNYKAAMYEERESRKAIQRELEDIKQRNMRMEQTFQEVLRRSQQPQKVPDPIPDYNEDPLGHIARKQAELEDYAIRQNQYLKMTEQQQRQQAVESKFLNDYRTAAGQFAKEAPDFVEAYNYVAETRLKEYKAAGYTDAEANKLLIDDERAIVAKAFMAGENPAKRIYELAKVRGYSKARQSAEGDPMMEKIDQKLDQLERGMKSSRSLNGVGGSSTSQPMTLERLAMMEPDEMDKHWDKIIRGHSQFRN